MKRSVGKGEGEPEQENDTVSGVLFKRVCWLGLALVLASLYPGRPTIEPTEGCPEETVERYLELKAYCGHGLGWDPRLTPPPDSVCFERLPKLRDQCREALGYDMNWAERFLHYGPFWFQLAQRVFDCIRRS